MAQQTLRGGIRVFSIVSPDGAAQADIVPELGGIVSSLRLGPPGERLFRHGWFWDPDAEQTRGGIPLLFPVCGRLLKEGTPGLYHLGGQPYVLPIHGFAMRRPWEVADATRPDALRLRLADSALTRTMYPFAFGLDLRFRVSSDGFSCELTVRNTGEAPMPYSAGFHPYFATPPPDAGKHRTRFEAHPVARLLYNETKTDVVGAARPPTFPRPVVGDEINGLLLDVGARGDTRLLFPDGSAIRQTASPLFRLRQFYTLPDEPFFCDEPWMAPTGSLHRPGAARLLPPGQEESGQIQIQRLPPPPDAVPPES